MRINAPIFGLNRGEQSPTTETPFLQVEVAPAWEKGVVFNDWANASEALTAYGLLKLPSQQNAMITDARQALSKYGLSKALQNIQLDHNLYNQQREQIVHTLQTVKEQLDAGAANVSIPLDRHDSSNPKRNQFGLLSSPSIWVYKVGEQYLVTLDSNGLARSQEADMAYYPGAERAMLEMNVVASLREDTHDNIRVDYGQVAQSIQALVGEQTSISAEAMAEALSDRTGSYTFEANGLSVKMHYGFDEPGTRRNRSTRLHKRGTVVSGKLPFDSRHGLNRLYFEITDPANSPSPRGKDMKAAAAQLQLALQDPQAARNLPFQPTTL